MTLVVAFLPTLVAKKIIYGSYFNVGYTEQWFWNSPAFFKVCFSLQHRLSSYGNRLFVGFTPFFVLGLAALVDWLAHAWQERRAAILAWSATAR